MARKSRTRTRAFAAVVVMALSLCLFGAVPAALAAEQSDGQPAADLQAQELRNDLSAAYGAGAVEYIYQPSDAQDDDGVKARMQAGYLGYGRNAEWRYYILGDGTAEITAYRGNATTVIIPDAVNGRLVTAIADFEVDYMDPATGNYADVPITSITIPKSVTRIGESSAYFDAVCNVYIANGSVTSRTKSDRKVALSPANVFSDIGVETKASGVDKDGDTYTNEVVAFAPTLKTIKVAKGNKKFKAEKGVLFNKKGTQLLAFPNAKKGKYAIPAKVKSVAPYAFRNATAKKVTTSKGMKTIGEYAFSHSLIANITIANGVKKIEKRAFFYAGYNHVYSYLSNAIQKMKKISIPGSVKTIGESAFQYSSIQKVSMGNGVKTIGPWAFANTRLKSASLPSSVKTLDIQAFYENPQLTKIKLNNGLKTIGVGAFEGTGIKTITIPATVNKMKTAGKYVQNYIGGGGYVRAYSGNPFRSWLSRTSKKLDGTISVFYAIVPSANSLSGEFSVYYNKNRDKAWGFVDGSYAMSDKLKSINVAKDNKKYASVKGVLFNKKMTTLIAYPAAKKGSTYTVPKKVKTIATNAFAFNQNLKSIKFNKKLRTIGDFAFFDTSLDAVAVPAQVSSLGMGAFISRTTSAILVYNENIGANSQMSYKDKQAAYQKRIPLNLSLSTALAVSDGLDFVAPDLDGDARTAYRNSLYYYRMSTYGIGKLGNYRDDGGNILSKGNYSSRTKWNALISLF